MNEMSARPNRIAICFVILIISLNSTAVFSQSDTSRLKSLIAVANEIFVTPYANGVLLSPYEIVQHHRSRTVKNIALVDSIYFYGKRDTVAMLIKDNQTIIHKPNERFNARTYVYHKDGRINKVLRGRHLDDEYIYDNDGYLIQHGHGGELKKAKRNGRIFNWYKVNKNELVYITTFNEQGRLEAIKTQRQNNVEYNLENYTWEGIKVSSKNTIIQYQDGGADTTYLAFEYDSLGLIRSINSREDESARWSKVAVSSKIDYLPANVVRIALFNGEIKVFSITFDQYDNWIELENFNQLKTRKIIYRKKRRKR